MLPVSRKCASNSDHNARSQSAEKSILPNTSHLRRAHHDGLLHALCIRERYRALNYNIHLIAAFLVTFNRHIMDSLRELLQRYTLLVTLFSITH